MVAQSGFGAPLGADEVAPGSTFASRVDWCAGGAWMAIAGELDAFATPELRRELRRVEAGQPAAIVLDLRGLTFLDSSGLAVILGAHERARERGGTLKLVIAGAHAVESTFRLIDVDEYLDVVAPPDEALAAVGE